MVPALYSDNDILILDKPSGLPSQPGQGVRVSVVEAVERDYGFRPWLVHRLDRDTAGCLIVARSARAAADASALLESRRARKLYRAVVLGGPDEPEGQLSSDVSVRGKAVAALTRYRLLGRSSGLAYVEAELGTGRMHQLRQHFADSLWPILADDRYGNFSRNKELARLYGAKRLFLWSWRLVLPLSQGVVDVRSSVPPHFMSLLEKLELDPLACDDCDSGSRS